MSLSPRVIALLGFGEAGSAIARGLCAEAGWRGTPKPGDNAPRRVIAIDTALDKDARGTALGKEAKRLDVAIESGSPVPRHFRERFKTLGPSNRPDLGKQAGDGIASAPKG